VAQSGESPEEVIMPSISTQVPKEARELRTISLRRMLTGLTRADVLGRLWFYGTLCGLIVSALIYCGSTGRVFAAGPERVGLPWDWSHEHLLFSKTDDAAVLAIIQKDPRAFHQWLRRNRTASQGDGVPISLDGFLQSDGSLIERLSPELGPESRSASEGVKQVGKRDWGVSLGATQFSAVNATNSEPPYPAKYTFDINATPSCENDFVTFPTSASGAMSTDPTSPNGQASIIAYNQLYSSQGGTTGICGDNGPSVLWAYINAACPTTTSSDPIVSSPVISLDGTKVAWVTSTGKVQIVTYGTGATIAGGDESILAPVCMGSVSSGGDGASLQTITLGNATRNPTSGVTLSAIFVDYTSDSAYVGDNDGYLHKIQPFFTASGALQEITTPAWQASHAYAINSLIVDTHGFIEKCTTAGTSGLSQPNWSTTWNSTLTDNTVVWTNIGSVGGWPVYVTGSSNHLDNVALNGPIFDFVSKNVFVGDQNGSLYYVLDPGTSTAVGSCVTGRVLYPCLGLPAARSGITATAGAQADCAAANPGPTCMVMSNKQGFTDPLVVDSSDSLVITQFSDADGTNATVEQTNTSLSVFNSARLAAEVNLSHHTGAFDNNYFNDPASGYYYVCGPDATVTALYRVGFTSASGAIALGSVNGTPLKLTTTNTFGNCSPLTEIYNASTTTPHDWLFLSLDNNGKTAGCGGGSCVISLSLEDTTAFANDDMVTGVNSSYGPGIAGDIANMNGTGGMVIDNVAAVTTTAAKTVIAASESGTTATITTSATLAIVVGQNIDVSGMGAAYAGYDTTSAAVTCIGASCATGATASSISYTAATSGLSSCSTAGTCAGKAFGVGYGEASSIYFMPVANDLTCGDGTADTGCAVKLTQAGLK
jgi:hypothetical protein